MQKSFKKNNCKYCLYYKEVKKVDDSLIYYYCKKEKVDLIHPQFTCNKFKKRRG